MTGRIIPTLTREELEGALTLLTWTRRQWAAEYKLDPETIDTYSIRHKADFPVPLLPHAGLRTLLYWREDVRDFMTRHNLPGADPRRTAQATT